MVSHFCSILSIIKFHFQCFLFLSYTIMQIDKNEVEKAIYFTFSQNTKNRLSCKLNSTKLKICFSEVYNTNQYVLYLYIPFKTKPNIVTSDLALNMILFDLLIQIYFSRAIFFIYSISQAIESKRKLYRALY